MVCYTVPVLSVEYVALIPVYISSIQIETGPASADRFFHNTVKIINPELHEFKLNVEP